MRTTLDLDDDLLAAAKPLARQRGVSLGRLISELAQQSLGTKAKGRMRNGVMVMEREPGAPIPTLELINRLRDED